MNAKRFLFFTVIMAIVVACSPTTLIVRQMTDMVEGGITAFERDSDLDFVEKAIPGNIKLLEAMLASNPSDDRLATLIARLYGSYAFGFVETRLAMVRYPIASSALDESQMQSVKKQVNRSYEKGMNYALNALEQREPGGRKAFSQVAAIDAYLNRMGRADVAPLFWYGFNLGAWVNHNLDSIRAVSRAHVARKVMERVLELEPGYHSGGAHLFLLAYFGSRSPTMGGSQANARHHYLQVKRIAGDDYRLADLFYARYCLPQQQDREGFVAILQNIIEHPPSDDDDALANAIAARRAQIYLVARDHFFD